MSSVGAEGPLGQWHHAYNRTYEYLIGLMVGSVVSFIGTGTGTGTSTDYLVGGGGWRTRPTAIDGLIKITTYLAIVPRHLFGLSFHHIGP